MITISDLALDLYTPLASAASQLRVKQAPAFRQGLILETANAFLDGGIETGKRLLRDYLNATGSLAAIARELRRDEKASGA